MLIPVGTLSESEIDNDSIINLWFRWIPGVPTGISYALYSMPFLSEILLFLVCQFTLP